MDIFSKQRITFWIIILLILLNVITIGILWHKEILDHPFAHDHNEFRKNLRMKYEDRFQKEIGLDDVQIKRINALKSDFFRETGRIRKELHQIRESMMIEVFNDKPNLARVDELARKIGDNETKLAKLAFHHFYNIKVIVRPDQQQKMKQFFLQLNRHIGPPTNLDGGIPDRPMDGTPPPPPPH